MAAIFKILLKVDRFKVNNLPDFLVTMVADLGALYISAKSPKVYPG